jgi:tetratricopeptide (TPR) repeat protein
MRIARKNEVLGCALAACWLLFAAPAVSAPGAPATPAYSAGLGCGPAPPGHPVKGRRDFRNMTSNADDLRDLNYHESYHIAPARKQLQAGNLQWDVMNNLNFVLVKVPNDHRALELLVQWDKAGGKSKSYPSPGCYLTWAAQFAPSDPMVWNYGGYFFYQKNDRKRAEQWWLTALEYDPANADVHYNLGLLYFAQGRYTDSRRHAEAAYSAGYPLPGLRDKLRKAGHWTDPQPAR